MVNPHSLTIEQLQVVQCNDRYVLCSACPGSGKTQTLVARAERLWRDYQEPILVCTFSNKACTEIRERLSASLNSDLIRVCTIHSLCYGLIREHWKLVRDLWGQTHASEWPTDPMLVTDESEISHLSQLFPKNNAPRLLEKIQDLRLYGLSPSDVMRLIRKGVFFGVVSDAELVQWRTYENERLALGRLTFDDMIGMCRTLLTFPQVSTRLSRRYSHVLVDEAQDTSSEQWAVLRLIMSTASTTLVVYDTNQCIYGWSGADKSFIQSLGLLMDSTKFSLTQNFRSGEAIGKLANRVCVDQRSQIKTLPGAEAVLTLQLFESRQEEVDFVLSTLTTKTGTRAVLARTNSYLELFERACLDSNIPYTGTGFYRTAPCVSLCEFLQEYEGSNAVSLARKAFLENGGYGKEEKADLQIALRIVADEGAAVFIERVLKSLDLQNKEQDSALILSTGHCSKGREWDVVAVCGVHNGQIPHSMSMDEEEERNLLYVMITRARSELLITAVGAYSPLIPADVY